ncbi:hypothetical protein HNP84_003902 [Thermocatellispora tengchongensis]|uniref:Uncharacterized protein n=1 Tax=Thermocatellispora tengchongensis TaxID=1073253 RepID=A0A840P6H1_9ACTN|nr:hypothetical protein [Thermocatellispora tengchongensis]MBB5134176.1 hypothetical protein [Thermocatellispora tengchongensis]
MIAYDTEYDDLDEFAPYEIGEQEFHEELSRLRPMNLRAGQRWPPSHGFRAFAGRVRGLG